MVQARFINDTTPIEVRGENAQTIINVVSQSESKKVNVYSTGEHENLTGRNKDNQHPISAITGLQTALDRADTYIHEQGVASDTWVITHNLGKYPSVTVVDSAGEAQIPDNIDYNSDNQLTIQFIGSFAGKAFLN